MRLINILEYQYATKREPETEVRYLAVYPQSSSDSHIGASPFEEGRRWSFAETCRMRSTADNEVAVTLIDFAC